MTDRDRLIELIEQAAGLKNNDFPSVEEIADHILVDGWIRMPCKVGDEIWVIDREDCVAVDISCVMFLAKSKGCIIATSWINDYDLDETLEYHIDTTQGNFDTELKVYPDKDCFLTKEEAEEKLKELKCSE